MAMKVVNDLVGGSINSPAQIPQNNGNNSLIGMIDSFTNKANEFNLASARETNEFNRQEAEKNRQWQEYMSNTAHQREVEDLLKAGLNPILSAQYGNGAAVTSGATAQGQKATGESGVNAFANLLGSVINQETALMTANINAQVQAEYFRTLKGISDNEVNASLINNIRTNETSAKNQSEYINQLDKSLKYQNIWTGVKTAKDTALGLLAFGLGNKFANSGSGLKGGLMKAFGVKKFSDAYRDNEGNWVVNQRY